MPEAKGIHLLLVDDGEKRAIQDGCEREVGPPSQLLAQRRDELLEGGDDRVAVTEAIQKDDTAPRLAHPNHFQYHLAVIRNSRHGIGGHPSIKALIRASPRAGIHTIRANPTRAQL